MRHEEETIKRVQADILDSRRKLQRTLNEMRNLENEQRALLEDEQRHRLAIERKRLEIEKQRFAQERFKTIFITLFQ